MMSAVDPDDLDEARRVMYEELADIMGEDRLARTLDQRVNEVLTKMYDQRDDIKEALPPEPEVIAGEAVDGSDTDS